MSWKFISLKLINITRTSQFNRKNIDEIPDSMCEFHLGRPPKFVKNSSNLFFKIVWGRWVLSISEFKDIFNTKKRLRTAIIFKCSIDNDQKLERTLTNSNFLFTFVYNPVTLLIT